MMDPIKLQLILGLLPIAERLIFDVGGQLIEINTADMTDPDKIQGALQAAQAEGFPQLKFVSTGDK